MGEKVRVLGIAPYENMKNVMAGLAREYPGMELTLFVGDRERGLEIARQNFHGNYDVVISRGGTASLLRKNLALPVVEIELSSNDLLFSLRLAGGLERRVAMVCAESIAASARSLAEVMELDLQIYVYDTDQEAEQAIRELSSRHFDAVLCDNVAYTTAKTCGLNAYLMVSSTDNIRKAFDRAMQLCGSQERLRTENLFLRELLRNQIGYTTILDDNGNVYLTTMELPGPELLELLRRELPESRVTSERRITRSLGGSLYMIRTRRVLQGSVGYTAFFYDIRRNPLSASHTGIRVFSRPEVEERYCRSVFSTSGYLNEAQTMLDQIAAGTAPVMIVGENGTGKESAVDILYLHSPIRNNPQVHINCAVLDEKEWDFLLEHHNSPLTDDGSTLFFMNADTMTPERCRRLISVLSDMRVCSRNRVFFSCVRPRDEDMSPLANEIVLSLCCLTLELPALRELSARIPTMVSMFISRLNEDVSNLILGMEPQAVTLLQQFHWPHNYAQFRRVMNELAVTASGQIITAEEVRTLLRKERHVGSFSPHTDNTDIPLDLNRTLEEINREIARRVVEETGGNQTAAARRLGISRTTLWRMVAEKP